MNNQKEYKELMLDYLDKLIEDIEDEYICEYAKKASRLEICKIAYVSIYMYSLNDIKALIDYKDKKAIKILKYGYRDTLEVLSLLSLKEIENIFPISKDKDNYVKTKKYFRKFDENIPINEYISALKFFDNYKNKMLFNFFLNRTKIYQI